MTIDDKIRGEKLQHHISRQAAEESAKSSGKIHKYECLKGQDVLSPDQSKVIEKVTFTYSPLGKAFEKQTKTIEDQEKDKLKL